jgi:peptide/nickel transport system substrate-binding protein
MKRGFFGLLPALLAAALAGALAVDLSAQPPGGPGPKKEEEEVPTPKPKKADGPKGGEEVEEGGKPKPNKVIRLGEDPEPSKVQSAAEAADLAQAAAEAKHPVVKALFERLARPHDLLLLRTRVERAQPVATYFGDPPSFPPSLTVAIFQEPPSWEVGDPAWNVKRDVLTGITYYERLVLNEVENFLKSGWDSNPAKDRYLSRMDMLRVAETALAAAARFSQSALATGQRSGPGFERLGQQLKARLIEVQLQQLNALTAANDWGRALALARRLVETSQPEDQEQIARPLVQLTEKVLNLDNYDREQMRLFQDRLRQLESVLPDAAAARPLHDRLRAKAQALFDQAEALRKQAENPPEPAKLRQAQELYQQAEEIYPRLPGLQNQRLRLANSYPIVRVAVRELPQNLAPWRAATDAERLAVELLFESLVEIDFDPRLGPFFEPCLAEGRPKLIPLGRQFRLARDAFWSNERPVTNNDVRHTVRLMRNPAWPGNRPWMTRLLQDVQVGGDPTQVNVSLTQGFVDPPSLLTFKVVPMEPWEGVTLTYGARSDSEARFNREPVGSGPYQFQGREVEKKSGRPYLAFSANPSYGNRASRRGQQQIREFQFHAFDDAEQAAALKDDKADLAPDLPADRAAEARALPGVRVHTVKDLRRIYFLAVNHRKAVLANEDLRRALAHAIDREAVLDACFRGPFAGEGGGGDKANRPHRALTGPYPPGTWACDAEQSYSQALAANRINEAAKNDPGIKGLRLTLKYPAKDSAVEKAVQAIQQQVKKEIGLDLALQPVPASELVRDVEVSHAYDLAYYHYDFPSPAYWLWPLFDPQGIEPGKGNYLGYVNDGQLEGLLRELNSRRDFSQLEKTAKALHAHFFLKMPFVPLWQLDRFVAVREAIKMEGTVDPVALFTDAERWRKEKR